MEIFLRQGVAESTAERYDRNAHEWQEFVGSRGFGHDPWMAGFAVEEKRALVVFFIFGWTIDQIKHSCMIFSDN